VLGSLLGRRGALLDLGRLAAGLRGRHDAAHVRGWRAAIGAVVLAAFRRFRPAETADRGLRGVRRDGRGGRPGRQRECLHDLAIVALSDRIALAMLVLTYRPSWPSSS
jgi:hypothetical protein